MSPGGRRAAGSDGTAATAQSRRRHATTSAGMPGDATRAGWLWDHAGRLAGAVLGSPAFGATVFVAAIGFKPALFLVVLLVAGIVIIAVGGRIRSA